VRSSARKQLCALHDPGPPSIDEPRARLRHDQRVRHRRPRTFCARVEHVGLASDHARGVPEGLGRSRDEEGVDVRVHAAVFGEHVEAHEVGLVGVGVVTNDGVVVGEPGDLGDRCDPVQLDQRTGQVPVEPVRQLVAVEHDGVGPEDLGARRDREVLHQMEGFDLRAEPEHEVGGARDPGHGDRDGTDGAWR
jgi:hypothetical protein